MAKPSTLDDFARNLYAAIVFLNMYSQIVCVKRATGGDY